VKGGTAHYKHPYQARDGSKNFPVSVVWVQGAILFVKSLNQWFYDFTSWNGCWEMKERPGKRLFFTVIGFFWNQKKLK
jgi:hypothetical protein